MNDLLHCSRYEYITILINGWFILKLELSLWISQYPFIYLIQLVVFQLSWINSIRIINRSIIFCHSHQNGSLLYEIPTCPIAHISKPLYNYFFAFQALLEPKLITQPLIRQQLPCSQKDSKSSTLSPISYSPLL